MPGPKGYRGDIGLRGPKGQVVKGSKGEVGRPGLGIQNLFITPSRLLLYDIEVKLRLLLAMHFQYGNCQ